ncbi:hypothetical protein GCM10009677_19830 [Sphaerisporangium rubeum]
MDETGHVAALGADRGGQHAGDPSSDGDGGVQQQDRAHQLAAGCERVAAHGVQDPIPAQPAPLELLVEEGGVAIWQGTVIDIPGGMENRYSGWLITVICEMRFSCYFRAM